MAPGAPTPACMRWVRSRMSTLSATGSLSGSPRGSTRIFFPIRSRSSAPSAWAHDFDARHSASARHYLYRIVNRRAPLTLDRGRAWRVKPRLDAEAMHAAARVLVGRHDFSTFRDAQCQANSPIRTLDRLDVRRDGDDVLFETSARSFLHRQVRSMVGSLVDVGSGRWSASDLEAALEAADRSRCGQVAPASRPLSGASRLWERRRVAFLPRERGGRGPPGGRWRGLVSRAEPRSSALRSCGAAIPARWP